MGNIVGAIVLGVIAIICFVFSYLQFNEKGVLFNNAYIYASKQERKNMDKKGSSRVMVGKKYPQPQCLC